MIKEYSQSELNDLKPFLDIEGCFSLAEEINKLTCLSNEKNFFIAGGALRDLLLCKEYQDIDLFTGCKKTYTALKALLLFNSNLT